MTPRPVRSARAGQDGFGQLLRAEWTKFRTVRGWVLGTLVAALVTVLFGLLGPLGSHASCEGPNGPEPCPSPPVGPGGEAVADRFHFVHRPLAGDGAITVRVDSLTGQVSSNGTGPGPGGSSAGGGRAEPWAKAGLIVKDGTRPGSAYAAIMITGGHGTRMQHNYTEDIAGRSGGVSAASPHWLRLTRSGDTLTGFESADGANWAEVGTVRLAGLPATVQAGLFATSPMRSQIASQSLGGSAVTAASTRATAVFDQVGLRGEWAGGAWRDTGVGGRDGPDGEFRQSGDKLTVAGSGDIAPHVEGAVIEQSLGGAVPGLIGMIVVGALFITAEYRRGLIRTTLAASPRRGRVLVAKAVVIGSVTFAAALPACAVSVILGARILRDNGNFVLPVPWLTELRVMAGTAALLAGGAVLGLAAGAVLRRGAVAVTAVISVIVLPLVLAIAFVLPAGPAEWLLRLSPAAAFAIQQSIPRYPQVSTPCSVGFDCHPLPPWAGLVVLCGYAALALGLAIVLLRRRDV